MSNQGMQVHHHHGEEGKRILAKQGLTLETLAKAIAAYQKTEQVHVGTAIGFHAEHGFFFSIRNDWNPDDPDAFSEPIGNIPWVQIHELLGNVPEGSTEGFVFSRIN